MDMQDDNKHRDRFSRMSGMSEEDFRRESEKMNAEARDWSDLVKKTIIGFLVGLLVSFLILNLIALVYSESNFGEGVGNYVFLAFEFLLLPIFLFDPKEDQKFLYETDKAVLLRNIDRKIKLAKTRLYAAIATGVVLAIVQAGAWYVLIINIQNLE
jgi:hypothetical protein